MESISYMLIAIECLEDLIHKKCFSKIRKNDRILDQSVTNKSAI